MSKYMSLKSSFQEQWWKQPKNVLRRMNALGLESKQNIRRVNQKEGKEGGKRNGNVWSSYKAGFAFNGNGSFSV